MKRADWREYRQLKADRPLQEGCTMSSNPKREASQARPSETLPPWRDRLQALKCSIEQFQQKDAALVRAQAAGPAVSSTLERAWIERREALVNVTEAMGLIIGHQFLDALIDFARSVARAEPANEEPAAGSWDDIYEPTDADSDIDLARTFEEDTGNGN